MCDSKMSAVMAVVVAVVLVVATGVAEGQSDCASKLADCANFINSTNPPASCCDSLKEAIDTQLTCICNLYNTPGLLESLRINRTEALSLPLRCNLSGDLSACNNATPPTGSSVPPPPGVPGNDGNSLRGLTWAGLPALFIFWASMVLY